MKIPSKRITGPACLAPVVFSIFLCGPVTAPAQELGVCTEQVLSATTESSVSVRLTGVNQWPVNPICFWNASGVGADGQPYRWQAVLLGDGLVGPPEAVNVSVQFRYEGPSGCSAINLNVFPPHPSAPFTNSVTSAGAIPDSRCGQDGPPLSFRGRLSLDASNNFTVDITFTGGTVDSDGDGVLDGQDNCPNTPPGAVVNEQGCSIDQLVPCAGPATGGSWRSHGQYVLAVARTAKAFHAAGLITRSERKAIVLAALRSDCGGVNRGWRK